MIGTVRASKVLKCRSFGALLKDSGYKLKEEIAAMSVQVENLEKNMAKLTIEVSAEELEKAIQSSYLKQKGK